MQTSLSNENFISSNNSLAGIGLLYKFFYTVKREVKGFS